MEKTVMSIIAHAGLDVHAGTIRIAILEDGCSQVTEQFTIVNDKANVTKHFKKLASRYDLRCCYEASGCGYVLQRWLAELGISCDVIAPSLIPRRSGDRIKTDPRDARNLAGLYRSGHLTRVHSPTKDEESVRKLVRLRETLVREIVESKNHLLKFLAEMGVSFDGRSNWTLKHWAWLRALSFEGTDKMVFSEYLSMLEFKQSRLREVEKRIDEIAASDQYKERVGKLCCLRGIGQVSAMVLITEVIDFQRFGNAPALMSFFGMVPSEHSSGASRHQGKITKAGNSHCRRVVVEAAWKYQSAPRLGVDLKRRQEGQPADVVSHSWTAQHRLHKKFCGIACRKERCKAVVATARELVGFVWAIMTGNTSSSIVAAQA
jgi:transposase